MAFGFLVEGSDLFLRLAAPNLRKSSKTANHEWLANLAGTAFLLLGIGRIAISAWRYFRTVKQIESEEELQGVGERFDLALAGLLVLLGCSILLYLSHAVVPAG